MQKRDVAERMRAVKTKDELVAFLRASETLSGIADARALHTKTGILQSQNLMRSQRSGNICKKCCSPQEIFRRRSCARKLRWPEKLCDEPDEILKAMREIDMLFARAESDRKKGAESNADASKTSLEYESKLSELEKSRPAISEIAAHELEMKIAWWCTCRCNAPKKLGSSRDARAWIRHQGIGEKLAKKELEKKEKRISTKSVHGLTSIFQVLLQQSSSMFLRA